ncbi:NusG domain II-containing protein [Eubacteriaceae bacterium ES2]|nr:NusG domain II-containing protein [Eubacteriaceae bacterium ES2]
MNKKEMMIVGTLILISLLGMGAFYLFHITDSNLFVRVSENGETIGEYPLDEDLNQTFETNDGYNVLTISGGKADITEADCPDQICVKTYPISSPGETIVCLPHKLVVEIVTGS